MGGSESSQIPSKYLNLCSKDKQKSYGFGTRWGWVINDRIFIFGWTIPLMPFEWCGKHTKPFRLGWHNWNSTQMHIHTEKHGLWSYFTPKQPCSWSWMFSLWSGAYYVLWDFKIYTFFYVLFVTLLFVVIEEDFAWLICCRLFLLGYVFIDIREEHRHWFKTFNINLGERLNHLLSDMQCSTAVEPMSFEKQNIIK